MGQLLPGTDGKDLNAVSVGIAAKAADQRVVFQLLVQTAAQAQHRTVHHRANAAHTLHVTSAFHFAQCVTDDGAAHAQLGGKIHLGRQTVGPGIAPGAQLFQQTGNDAVADDSAAQPAGRCKCRFLHGLVPPLTGSAGHCRDLEPCGARPRFVTTAMHRKTPFYFIIA